MSGEGCLYIVATPIGNLSDISKRALDTLGAVDFIAAEDTRVTVKLLNHFGIKKPLVSCFRYNEAARGEQIVARILAGESCALCCDAGTPAVSDPGEQLVGLAAARGVKVVPVPGPSAMIAALSASGLATGRFCFEGFLPVSNSGRRARLAELSDERRTMVFYEAPHKLKATLADLLEAFGERRITLARELTKIYEEFERTTLSAARAQYETREPRGEYVLIVEGAPREPAKEADPAEAVGEVRALVAAGEPLTAACKKVAAKTGIKKSELYRLAAGDEREK